MRRLYIRLAVLVPPLLAGCQSTDPSPSSSRAAASAVTTAEVLMRDVSHLASEALAGRATGTPGNDSAAAYIARQHASLGLVPGTADSAEAACAPRSRPARGTCPAASYFQTFAVRPYGSAADTAALSTQNVVAVQRGADPRLRGQYVVLGAHFDHLGRSALFALDPDSGDAIRNGADDNASGTAAVLELARRIAARPTRRSVVLVHFSAEELGLLGALRFVRDPPVPLDSVQAMLNFDMVGRMRGDSLLVYGVGTARELAAILKAANTPPALTVVTPGGGFGSSDHAAFWAKGIPVLHFFTNLHEDYHRATDDSERINVDGLVRVVEYAERVVRAIADREEGIGGRARARSTAGEPHGQP